jgi:crossover junction endodeoxyribonuclease RuvC
MKPGRFEGGGMRFVKFRKWLNEVYDAYRFEQVFFEEIRMHRGVDAAHIYGGLMAVLTAWCEEKGVPYEGVHYAHIKKHWGGKGNAKKEDMMNAAFDRGYSPSTDDEADALALFDLKADDVAVVPAKMGVAA